MYSPVPNEGKRLLKARERLGPLGVSIPRGLEIGGLYGLCCENDLS